MTKKSNSSSDFIEIYDKGLVKVVLRAFELNWAALLCLSEVYSVGSATEETFNKLIWNNTEYGIHKAAHVFVSFSSLFQVEAPKPSIQFTPFAVIRDLNVKNILCSN